MSSDSSSDGDMMISRFTTATEREKKEDFGYTPTLRRISIVGYLLQPKDCRNVILNSLYSTE